MNALNDDTSKSAIGRTLQGDGPTLPPETSSIVRAEVLQVRPSRFPCRRLNIELLGARAQAISPARAQLPQVRSIKANGPDGEGWLSEGESAGGGCLWAWADC